VATLGGPEIKNNLIVTLVVAITAVAVSYRVTGGKFFQDLDRVAERVTQPAREYVPEVEQAFTEPERPAEPEPERSFAPPIQPEPREYAARPVPVPPVQTEREPPRPEPGGLDERFAGRTLGDCEGIIRQWVKAEETVTPVNRCSLYADWVVKLHVSENLRDGRCLMVDLTRADPELKDCLKSNWSEIRGRVVKATTVEVRTGEYRAVRRTPVRKLPSKMGEIVKWLKPNTTVDVVGGDRGYYRIESRRGRAPGYVEMNDFEFVR
jgi:hypothetical protein